MPFAFEELFFSRTDLKGHILSGNSVFQRISHYSWDELVDKAHSIIRHPDMPRAVFWLLWETIKNGRPIGAYVKNRAKDGRYYWVFAIVTPVEGGYLSVRLKPSVLLSVVDGEYKALIETSVAGKLSPKDSAAILLQRLKALGFENYDSFMAAALSKECAARDQKLGRPRDPMVACFDDLVVAGKSLLDQAEAICTAYEQNKHVPLNLSIQATQLGSVGATIGVVSNNYEIISREIKENMDRFMDSARAVVRTINDGLFLLCVANIQREVVHCFAGETAAEHSAAGDMALLRQQQQAYQQKALDGLKAIAAQANRFRQDCAEMKRLSAGLGLTRVMGKIESSRLGFLKNGLNELIEDLESLQSAITDGVEHIRQSNQSIQHEAGRLLGLMERQLALAS